MSLFLWSDKEVLCTGVDSKVLLDNREWKNVSEEEHTNQGQLDSVGQKHPSLLTASVTE